MTSFLNFLLHLIFVSTFLILFVVSIIILRPFRIHRSRPRSTISLKISYLVYLLAFLLLSYLVLFFSGTPAETEEQGVDPSFYVYYVIVIFAFIVPNLAIMLRRKVKRFRESYNVIFTVLNMLIVLSLVYIMLVIPWEF